MRAPSRPIGAAFVAIVIAACDHEARSPRTAEGPLLGGPNLTAVDGGTGPGAANAEATPGPRAEIAIVAEEPSPARDRLPSISFLAPKANQAIGSDKLDGFEIKLDVRDWSVARGGAHVNVVLDNQPYRSIYDPSDRIRLGDFTPDQPLAEGQHVLVAFPVEDTHVSVKPDRGKIPATVVIFSVTDKAAPGGGAKRGSASSGTGANRPAAPAAEPRRFRLGEPMLIYSRPKGTYNGSDADRILLDFYLLNAPLADGRFSVRATVTPTNGAAASVRLTRWTPFSISNLPNGDTKVLLELVDPEGRAVSGLWGRVEQVVTVNREAASSSSDRLLRE